MWGRGAQVWIVLSIIGLIRSRKPLWKGSLRFVINMRHGRYLTLLLITELLYLYPISDFSNKKKPDYGFFFKLRHSSLLDLGLNPCIEHQHTFFNSINNINFASGVHRHFFRTRQLIIAEAAQEVT